MKVSNFDVNNEYSSTDEGVEVEFIKIDKNITHSLDTSSIPWEGLNTDFIKNFAVSWEGYIKIEDDQYINFELCTTGGRAYIYIDNTLVLSSYTTACNSGYLHKVPGYYSIRIAYSAGSGGREFRIKYSNDKYDFTKMYRYVPNSKLEYTYNQATYITGASITSNSPILTSGVSVKSYEAITTLPSGLSVDETSGLITGKATTKQDRTAYQIQATLSDDTKVTTTIYIIINGIYYIIIIIIEMVKPQGIFLTDTSSSSTEKLTTLTMSLGKRYVYSIGVETGTVISFIIDNPPKGCEYDTSFSLICIPSEEGEYNFTIKAVAPDDSLTPELIKANTTTLCTDGKKYHTYSFYHTESSFQFLSYSITDVATGNELVPTANIRVSIGFTYKEFDEKQTYGGACQLPGEVSISTKTSYTLNENTTMKVYVDGLVVMDWKFKGEYMKTYSTQINTSIYYYYYY